MLIGAGIGLTCVVAACAGLWLLGAGLASGVIGSYGAGLAYKATGGVSEGGLAASRFWGGIGAGAGFALGYGVGGWAWNRWVVETPPVTIGEAPPVAYRIGTLEGRWYSSAPLSSLRAVEGEFSAATRPMLWQQTYRITAQLPSQVGVGPLGTTGLSQFEVLTGSPTILSTQLYTIYPGVIAGLGSLAGLLASQLPS